MALTKFWETSPTAWFTVAESLFSAQNVVSEHIKFHSVLNALEAKHIEKVKHVLMVTSSTSLKQALIKSFEASDNFKLYKLLSLPALDPESNNSKRPTELLQEMRCLLGQGEPLGSTAETLLKKLFIEKLPAQIRIILAASHEITLDGVADKADSIMQVVAPSVGQGASTPTASQVSIRNRIINI